MIKIEENEEIIEGKLITEDIKNEIIIFEKHVFPKLVEKLSTNSIEIFNSYTKLMIGLITTLGSFYIAFLNLFYEKPFNSNDGLILLIPFGLLISALISFTIVIFPKTYVMKLTMAEILESYEQIGHVKRKFAIIGTILFIIALMSFVVALYYKGPVITS